MTYKKYKIISDSIDKDFKETGIKISAETEKALHLAWGDTMKSIKKSISK